MESKRLRINITTTKYMQCNFNKIARNEYTVRIDGQESRLYLKPTISDI